MNVNSGTTTIPRDDGEARTGNLPSLHWTPTGLVETTQVTPANVRQLEEQMEASHADAAPMGLFGFAVGTLLASIVVAGWYPSGTFVATIPALIIFAGVAQFIAGLLSFNRGSTFGGTVFCSYGAGNVLLATFLWMQHLGFIPVVAANTAMMGIALFCFAYISAMLCFAALRANAAYALTLFALIPGYALAAVPMVGGGATVGHIGGWFLAAAAVFAFYSGGAVVVNSNWKSEVLPIGNLTR